MKTITSTIIAIALTLAAGLDVAEGGIGGAAHPATAEVAAQGYANLTVNDLLRM